MAVARDTQAYFTAGTSTTSFSNSFTVTGSNPLLVVWIVTNTATSADIVSSVSYNGVALSRINTISETGYQNVRLYCYALAGPSTGANNLVVNLSSSDTPEVLAASYTGTLQSTPTISVTNTGQSITSLALSLTTTADNSWVAGFFRSSASSLTASTNTTFFAVGNNNAKAGDTNGVVHPAGSTSVNATSGSAIIAGIALVVAPFVTPAVNSNFLAFM